MSPALSAGVFFAARQVLSATPDGLSEILEDGVNLAVWQRRLPGQIEEFVGLLLGRNVALAESTVVTLSDCDAEPELFHLASAYADLPGHAAFVADVKWLVCAYACLMGARRIGLRLRVLDKAMCPRFHVDHVPVRLITTYAGVGSEWLKEGATDRTRLKDADAEPTAPGLIEQIGCADVALLKGEKWTGNEGFGLVHRSPQLCGDQRRLLLTLDWLA